MHGDPNESRESFRCFESWLIFLVLQSSFLRRAFAFAISTRFCEGRLTKARLAFLGGVRLSGAWFAKAKPPIYASPNPSTSQPLQMQTWETERRNLMAQGLCYRCHEKFAPGHKCKFAKLSCMDLTGGDQLEDVDWVNATTVGDSQETNIAEISFHAILGQSVGSTMKLQGEINHRKVLILVDSGSTHNFVVESVVEKHKVPVEIVPTFGVQIGNGGNGAIIRYNKVCQNLQIQLPGFTITQDYYPSALGGADLVFGINWLVSLNTIQLIGRICS
ncbi:hypothetical protein KY285_026782 [Solanum tuberosum]|nr:hypothetical protein KY285_026782 [Solanum tuberosum]